MTRNPADVAFGDMVAQAALCCRPTIDNTWDLVRDVVVRGVAGDLVECGVFAGAQPAVMARASELRRRVHLFDSFAGIPMAGPEDDESITGCIGVPPAGKVGALESTGVSACSAAQVQSNLARWGVGGADFVFHVGWFQDTVPVVVPSIDAIAVLRLDGDLYASTRVCLEHLYPKLTRGGYCIVDDYALTGCRRAVTEYLASIGEAPEIVAVEGGMGVSYWQKLK